MRFAPVENSRLAKADFCPECDGDLRGDPIPDKYQGLYGGATHYREVIGIEYEYGHPERYDGISEFMCPHCGYREGRWSGRTLREGEVEPRWGGRP